jgi:hypothetical protein
MKNSENPGAAPIGPRDKWAEWRARRDKSLANPRRNAAALRLNATVWQPIALAPRDGTLLLLLVEADAEDINSHPLEDSALSRTVGFNNFDHDGEDVWQMAGWCWDHDHFTAGHGQPKKWMLFPNAPGNSA